MNKFFNKIIGASLAIAMMIGVGVAVNNGQGAEPNHALSGALGAKVTPSNFAANKTVIMVDEDVTKYVKTITTGSSGWLKTDGGTQDNAMEFTLGGTATAASLKTPQNKYVGFTGTKNVSLNDSSTAPFYLDASGIVCVGNSNSKLRHNDSSKGFRVYDNDYKVANLYYVSTGTAASINGENSVNVGTQWMPTSITENESGNAVSSDGLTYSFVASDGATISSSDTSTGAFTASTAGTVTVSATKSGFEIADKVVIINSLAPYINLTLTSAENAFTGQNVTVTAEYGNGVAGLEWEVTSGVVTGATSSNSSFSAKIGGETGTLTVKAKDTASDTFAEVSVSVTKVEVSLDKTSVYIPIGQSETLTANHNAAVYGEVTWSSDNAKVSVNGGVVTVANDAEVGTTAIITATSSVDTDAYATCLVTVSYGANLDLTSKDSFTTATNALLICEVPNVFEIRIDKNTATTAANNYYPGNDKSSTRFYKNAKMTVTANSDYAVTRVEFTATSNGYAKALKKSAFTNATAEVPNENAGGLVTVVTPINGALPFSAIISDTCGFETVKLFYVEKTAKQIIETNLTTKAALSYTYKTPANNPGAFENVAIRFGGQIEKSLWTELNGGEKGKNILGYGVMLAANDYLKGDTIIEDYELMADDLGGFDNAFEVINGVSFLKATEIKNFYNPISTAPYESGDQVIWNLYKGINNTEKGLKKGFSAVAYINTVDGIVFFKETSTSAVDLAKAKYAADPKLDETLGGSLSYLASLA